MSCLGEPFSSPLDRSQALLGERWSFEVSDQPLHVQAVRREIWSDNISLTVFDEPDRAGRFLVSFPKMVQFDVSLPDRTIRGFSLSETGSTEVLRHLLADQVLPRLISHQGHLVLHAGAVDTPQGAVIIAGLSGKGKSTLTASLHVDGHALIGDDAIVISTEETGTQCQAVYRSLRLFPDSIASVFAATPVSGPVAHYTRKKSLQDLGRENRWISVPVRCLYILGADSSEIGIRPLVASDACMTLLQHSFALDPTDRDRALHRLRQASALAAQVPVFEISFPRDYARLPEVRATILEQFGASETQRAQV